MKGQRVVWPSKGKVEIQDFEVPEINENEVLVATEYTLISPGTERAWLLGLPNTPMSFPSYPGYSNIGKVIEVGSKVREFASGDRVASTSEHKSHLVLPPEDLIKITDNSLSSEEAVFFNLCSICLQGVRKAGIELGEPVLVLGQGLIGLLTMQLAKLSGAFPVIGADLVDSRLRLAKNTGADFILHPEHNKVEQKIAEITKGKGPAVVFEASGTPEAVTTSFKLAGLHGRVVLIASTRGETDHVNFYRDVHKKGLVIIGAHNSVRPRYDSSPYFWTMRSDSKLALQLIAQKRLQVTPLISHRLEWADSPKAYKLLMEGDNDLLGVVLDWRSV